MAGQRPGRLRRRRRLVGFGILVVLGFDLLLLAFVRVAPLARLSRVCQATLCVVHRRGRAGQRAVRERATSWGSLNLLWRVPIRRWFFLTELTFPSRPIEVVQLLQGLAKKG